MTVLVSKPAINLREILAKVAGLSPSPKQETFFYSGDTTTTNFPLPKGWKPVNVFENGSLLRPGSGEDYTISYDGFIYTVVFAVAPAVVDVGIICEQEFEV
ncbi:MULTISPECIES: hypothetical protein [unclassified Marinobacterium]|uniref:hypothetical protein n=1 Tax=unclassified Marinobacterium TaxID=2644139 RepID=UPI0015698CDC|nr:MULTISPECIES: hypothetical protein [unclassified Marinobacterium]NRP58433.1 hypothetical protein [Marinobacterium sp. xm-d-510]NRP84110.1 hypothetical protein [Marinobacterium sp. xm-d-509]